MNRIAIAALALLACPGPDGVEPQPEPDVAHPSWAVGFYYADAYKSSESARDGYGYQLLADGTHERNSPSGREGSGKWSWNGTTLLLDGKAVKNFTPNCRSFAFDDDSDFYRSDAVTGCPLSQRPLSDEERCLAGVYESGLDEIGLSTLDVEELSTDRLYVDRYQRDSATRGTAYFTTTGWWEISATDLVIHRVSGADEPVRIPLRDFLRARTRTGAAPTGCAP